MPDSSVVLAYNKQKTTQYPAMTQHTRNKKRIYVAYTGGTIGMQHSANGFVPVPGFLSETVRKMPELS